MGFIPNQLRMPTLFLKPFPVYACTSRIPTPHRNARPPLPRHISQYAGAWSCPPYRINLSQRVISESTCPAKPMTTWHTCRKSKSVCRVQMSVIPADSGKALFGVLAACAAFAQVMENNTKWGSYISAPLIAMGTTMFLSGFQFIPVASQTYDSVFTLLMPMAVSLSLLEIDVKRAFSDAGNTLKAFWLGAFGTILGTIISFKIVGHSLGLEGWKIASCLCASYIGGSINYAATAQALGLTSSSLLAAGMAADNLATAGYFALIFSMREKCIGDGQIEDKLEVSKCQSRQLACWGHNFGTVTHNKTVQKASESIERIEHDDSSKLCSTKFGSKKPLYKALKPLHNAQKLQSLILT